MLNDKDDLISINKPKLKQAACDFLDKSFVFYLAINRITTNFFANLFDKNSKMHALFSLDSLSLVLNAALLAIIGNIFGGFIGRVTFILVLLNIIAFLANQVKGEGKK